MTPACIVTCRPLLAQHDSGPLRENGPSFPAVVGGRSRSGHRERWVMVRARLLFQVLPPFPGAHGWTPFFHLYIIFKHKHPPRSNALRIHTHLCIFRAYACPNAIHTSL